MSGFVGIIHFDQTPVQPDIIERMTNRLRYRGPDRQNIHVNSNAAFGHTLFVVSPEMVDEQQPFTLGALTLVGDIRLDRRDELIASLEKRGHPVNARMPDSYLVNYAYREWGEACVDHLRGDFGFAIWDAEVQRLVCARDQMGVRPLYYVHVGNVFLFSNEITCLRSHPLVSDELDGTAVGNFLLTTAHRSYGSTTTMYQQIRQLAAAQCAMVEQNQVQLHHYWSLNIRTPMLRYRTDEDYVEHFRVLLQRAVRDRMRSDNMVISLSGGLDSPTLAAIAKPIADENNIRLRAFTGVYDMLFEDRERYFSGLVAQKLMIPQFIVPLDDYEFLNPLVPTIEPSFNFQWGMMMALRQHVGGLARLEMIGRAGDEIFSYELPEDAFLKTPVSAVEGYIKACRYYGIRVRSRFKKIVKNWLRGQRKPTYALPDDIQYPTWLNPDFEKRYDLKAQWQSHLDWQPTPRHPFRSNTQGHTFRPDWLNSAEYPGEVDFAPTDVVLPFLDVQVVEFALSLPPFPWSIKKYILRKAMTGILPDEVLTRAKTPIGYIAGEYTNKPETEWIDHWKPVAGLEAYILRDSVPRIHGADIAPQDFFLNARPLLLNTWLLMKDQKHPVRVEESGLI